MSAKREEWASRVRDWKRSGKSLRAFTEGKPFKASTLRWWATELRKSVDPTSDIRMLAVRPVPRVAALPSLVVEVGDARVVVAKGFDPTLLRDVVASLREVT